MKDSARTSRRHRTPSGFPFASIMLGSPNSNAPRAASAVRSPTRISPGAAPCSSRAETFTGSPVAKGAALPRLPDDDLARVDADPKRQALVELPGLVEHRERRVQSALCVV